MRIVTRWRVASPTSTIARSSSRSTGFSGSRPAEGIVNLTDARQTVQQDHRKMLHFLHPIRTLC